MSQLTTERVEEHLKTRMEMDRAKIESLEVELARMQIVVKQQDEALAVKDTTLATSESWR